MTKYTQILPKTFKCLLFYDGTYIFEVPYSTTGPIPDETNFDTRPTGPYSITAGNKTKTVDVAEQDVLNGGTITVNLIGLYTYFCTYPSNFFKCFAYLKTSVSVE